MSASFYSSYNSGCFSNIRQITYNGNDYVACDILVNQFGSCGLFITGLHPDISEIIEVTENFTEKD